ncbi:MAG TPA: hypothetical protein VMZ31_13145 [Phycisphaerae bacterium]|nr:hypothetical protein [Phycisphaerae bacterium]
MGRKLVKLLKWFLPVLLLVALAAVPARAAARDAREGVKKLAVKRPIPQWAMASLFAVGCLAIAFKNSKRTHLD